MLASMAVRPRQPSSFPITDLPIEIQLQILEACVVMPAPIVDILRSQTPEWYEVEQGVTSLANLSVQIIFTCRLYFNEGMRLFITKNKFLFTGAPVTFPVNAFKFDPFDQVTQVALLHFNENTLGDAIETLETAWDAAHHLRNLRTLEIDFTGPPDWCCLEDRAFQRLERMSKRIHNNPSPNLERISLAGLNLTPLAGYIIALLARLLYPAGMVGIGFGLKGRRYEECHVRDISDHSTDEHSPKIQAKTTGAAVLRWMNSVEARGWAASIMKMFCPSSQSLDPMDETLEVWEEGQLPWFEPSYYGFN